MSNEGEKVMKKEIKLLVLEDVEEDFQLIERTLKRAGLNFQTRLVDTKHDYLNALQEYNPDLILSDHSLPQFNSTEAFSIARQLPARIPFIIVTGNVSEEFAVNSIKQGADDYVLKSNLDRLPEAIFTALKKHEEENKREAEFKKLEENNQTLSRYNKDLGQFVSSVSSNLRSPLTNMLEALQEIKKDDSHDQELQSYFEMMETSIQKLDNVLADLEIHSERIQDEIKPELIDIDALIEEQLQLMQYMPGANIIEKDITVSTEEVFYSDRYHLNVIVNNLISNSIKYYDAQKSHPYIKVNVRVSKTRAYFEFRDNGIGIEEQSVAKIFDMFFRANGSKDGTGIGLHLVKDSIDKLKGTIEVQSSLGIGTIFRIQVPNLQPPDRSLPTTHYSSRSSSRNKATTA
jgi:signal transduction histidine kinase